MVTAAPLPKTNHGLVERLVVRVEAALHDAVEPALDGTPRALAAAIRHAVFSGGSRLRPSLCLAVAATHGDPYPARADAAAVAIELVHCASLVHDDLPCFDDATLRRGAPTVHAAHGVATAVLAGDALIVLAFAHLAAHDAHAVPALADATGPARGIIAGQAWESEPDVALDDYHRAKTASLFRAAALLGAEASGASCREAWAQFGDAVGHAYQAADDLIDASDANRTDSALRKSAGRDHLFDRPSAVRTLGVAGARLRVRRHVESAASALPQCTDEGARPVRVWLDRLCDKLAALGGDNGLHLRGSSTAP
jgi:geranylgeranyl diphosphate synthase type II